MTQNNQNTTLSEATGTLNGSKEQGALKEIHRAYNGLNGYEAMLHIINRYRFVLYPFIFLSIAGSSYSFFNDFTQAFPMLGNTVNLAVSIFFSVMLEIVRDGSIIAIFNGKMRVGSRALIIIIFLSVTTYMYSSHLKAIDVIEKTAVTYVLSHQDEKEVRAINPKYDLVVSEIENIKRKIESKKSEITNELVANTTSIYKAKRKDALLQKKEIEGKIEEYESQLSNKQQELIGFKQSNIQSVEDSQAIISKILLSTLLLIESLAMLGAVIKYINKDNAQKEIANHSEIIEEYISIDESMKQTNEQLKGVLSQSLRQQGEQSTQFLQAVATMQQNQQAQINQILGAMGQMQPQTIMTTYNAPVQQQMDSSPKIGFKVEAKDKKAIIKALYKNGNISVGEKLTSKKGLVNVAKRQDNQFMTNFYKELEQNGIIENRGLGRNGGYYAVADYQTAMQTIQPNS